MGAHIELPLAEIQERALAGESHTEIAKTYQVCQATISRRLRKVGVTSRFARVQRTGSAASNWKGGRVLNDDGYVLVLRPESEMADYRGYVLEHRLVMGEHLGRPLRSDETVHHIDNDREHNDITNLQLRIGRHGKGSAFSCLDCGSNNVASIRLAETED